MYGWDVLVMLAVRLLYIANLWKYIHSDEKGNQMSGCVCDLFDVPTTYAGLPLHSTLHSPWLVPVFFFLQPTIFYLPSDYTQPWRHSSDPMRAQLQALIHQQRLLPMPTHHASCPWLPTTSKIKIYNVESLART
jgi:hypothetical protein